MSNIAVVYGSLREGAYNHDAFKRMYGKGYNKLGSGTVTGFNLYSLGSYPFVAPTEENVELIVDVFECSEDCKANIDAMERGAGYKERIVSVDTENGTFEGTLYYIDDMDESRYPHVEDGDWINFKTKK